MDVLAYLDPGSGSILLQAILGGFAGLMVSFKLFGRRMVSFFFFWRRNTIPPETAGSTVDDG